MIRPSLSLVYATYNRGSLLARHIQTINHSEFNIAKLEVICVDDGSTDNTSEVIKEYDPKIDVKYIRLRKPTGLWRDTAAVINCGIRAAAGHVIILTHPEIMFGRQSLKFMLENADDNSYVCCKGYYLSNPTQQLLDTIPWRENPMAVRDTPGFYTDNIGNPDYTPRAIENTAIWESWICGGHTRKLWSHLGGIYETTNWGSVDLNWMHRRMALGIQNKTGPTQETFVIHQNHDSPRCMNAAFSQARPFSPIEAKYPAIDNLWGPISDFNSIKRQKIFDMLYDNKRRQKLLNTLE